MRVGVMSRAWSPVLAGLLLVGSAASTSVGAGPAQPTFEVVSCDSEQFAGRLPVDAAMDIECGLLTVQENRHARFSEGNQVVLPVAVFKAIAPKPKSDPVVLINGGPGGGALEYFVPSALGNPSLIEWAAELVKDRDVIMMDQRGAGKATPSTKCPGMLATLYSIVGDDLDPVAEKALLHSAIVVCVDDLRTAGVDLDQYDTPTLAADLRDLRRALGIRRWNVYGHSYGGQVALELLRQEPSRLRSVVLDAAAVPYEDTSSLPSWAARARRGFEAIASAHEVNNLEGRLAGVIEKFNDAPYVTSDPYTGAALTLTGEDAMHVLHSAMYLPDFIPLLDLFVWNLEASGGDDEFDLGSILGFPAGAVPTVLDLYFLFFYPLFVDGADGMFNAIQCADQAGIAERMDLTVLLATEPVYGGKRFDYPEVPQVCDLIQVAEIPWAATQVSRTSVPTLVRHGSLDIAHPPEWSETLSTRLGPRAQYIEFPMAGHNVQEYGDCAIQTLVQFITHPNKAVDTSCIRG